MPSDERREKNRIAAAAYRERNRELLRERDRLRDRKGRKRTRPVIDPAQVSAYNKVARAIREGRLVPQPCEECGTTPVHAHHADYTKPLDVRWLCPLHHKQAHREAA